MRQIIDPLEVVDHMIKRDIPLPVYDDIDAPEHEFSPEFNEKMDRLFKTIDEHIQQNTQLPQDYKSAALKKGTEK